MSKRVVYVYRPDHPQANELGIVELSLVGCEERVPGLYVIPDTMPDTRHMADGKFYNSKSKFRKVTRDHGCVEVGNELRTMNAPRATVVLDKRQRRDDIRRAFWEVRNGRRTSREG